MSYEPSSFDLAAAELRRSGDRQELLGYLATKLQSALPDQTSVERSGLFGRGPIRRVAVTVGEHTYSIEDRHRSLVGQRARMVRGIEISHEEITVDYWVRELTAELKQLAQQSERYGEAIRRLALE